MKKVLSATLAVILSLLCAFTVFAEDCSHTSCLRSFVSANCSEKGHTLYTCQSCGYSYKIYDDEYETPENFYILASSVREDSALTVTVEMYNNPGLIAGRLKLGYNASTLAVRSFTNGEIWSEKDYTAGIKTENNPLVVFTEDYTTGVQKNTNNGLYFTVVFDILDPDGAYGIYLTHGKADFHSWDSTANTTVKHSPTIINIVGKSELGDHSYISEVIAPTCTNDGFTAHTCEFCGDSYSDTETAAAGHVWEYSKTLKEPTFTEEGLDEYICSACTETKSAAVPVLEHWEKGDINGDGIINAIDSNLLKRIMVGTVSGLQQADAADYNGDGEINAIDAYYVKTKVAGQ